MRIVQTKNDIVSATWHLYISSDENGPYYEIGQDTDTEYIEFHDPKANIAKTVQSCLAGYSYGASSITEVIKKDMEIRGLPPITILDPPWDD